MLVGDLISASMEEQLPLQAAELLGWHLQRNYAKQQLDATDYKRLIALVDTSGAMFEWESEHLKDLCANAFLKAASRKQLE